MKPLGSITAIVLAAVLTGLATSGIAWVNFPHDHALPLVGIWAGMGAGLGVLVALPLVAGDTLRARRPGWLDRHAFRLNWYLSLTMVGSMGYLLALARHGTLDNIGLVAIGLVFAGAMGKACLANVYEKPPRWARGS